MHDVPSDWTPRDAQRWLLTELRGGASAIPLPCGVAFPVAVRGVYQRAGHTEQQTIKAGVVLALDEWQYGADGYPALASVATVAALIRATAAIPRLAEVIRRECGLHRHDPASMDALATCTASLAGFAPAVDLDRWLRIVFYDGALPPSLGGLLFVGLCKGRPDSMALHADRLLELANRAPEAYDHIGFALLDAVPPVEMVAQIRPMATDVRAWFSQRLSRVPHPELRFEFGDAGIEMVWIKQPQTRVTVSSESRDMSVLYQRQIAAISGDDPNTGLLKFFKE